MLTEEYKYKVLRLLESNPRASQRELAKALGISLGKLNYCLQALIKVGLIKVNNFKSSNNKLAYMYVLTPQAIEDRAKITKDFLKLRLEEYRKIKEEIASLRKEVD